MGRNESMVELLVKVWEGIREFLEVPNKSTGSFFRHMRVHMTLFKQDLKNFPLKKIIQNDWLLF